MRGVVLGLCFLALTGAAFAQDATTPVAIGGNAGKACLGAGTAGADTDVRVGPGERFEVYDHLKAGAVVFVCDVVAKGWVGILYGKKDCGADTPVAERRAYTGGCNTGWISTKAVAVAAE